MTNADQVTSDQAFERAGVPASLVAVLVTILVVWLCWGMALWLLIVIGALVFWIFIWLGALGNCRSYGVSESANARATLMKTALWSRAVSCRLVEARKC